MKKNKLKSLLKTAKKSVRTAIKLRLITDLKEITGKLGEGSKRLENKIEAGAKELAKKLSKEIKIDKSAILEADNEQKDENVSTPTNAPKTNSRATGKNTETTPRDLKAAKTSALKMKTESK